MRKLVSTTVAALATLSLAAIVCAADLPDSSGGTDSATVTGDRVQTAETGVQTDKTEKRESYHGPQSKYRTAADKVTAPLNPPAVPREMMVTPARPGIK